MKAYYLLITLLFTVDLISQNLPDRPFKPIKLKDFETKWYQNLFDSTAVGKYDGYNQFRKGNIAKIKDEYIYITASVTDTLGTSGFVVEKRKISDGNLVWRAQFGYPKTNTLDVVRSLFVNENGNVEIFGQQFPEKYLDNENGVGSNDMVFTFRLLNGSNGIILKESIGDPKDPDAFRSLFNFLTVANNNSFYRLGENDYLFWEYRFIPNKPKHWVRSRVSAISKISTTQTDSIALATFPSLIPPIQLDNGNCILIEQILGKFSLIIRKIDKNLNVLSQDTTSALGPKILMNLLAYDTINEVLLVKNNVGVDGLYYPHDLLWIGIDGKIHKQIHLDRNIAGNFTIIDWDMNGATLIANYLHRERDFGNTRVSLNIIRIQDTTVSLIKRWASMDTLQALSDFIVAKTADGTNDKIITWVELSSKLQDTQLSQDFNAMTTSVLRISSEELLSEVNDELVRFDQALIKVHPNPVYDQLFVDVGKYSGELMLMDCHGHLIARQSIDAPQQLMMDVSTLSQGIYIVSIRNDKGMHSTKFIKL